MLLPKWFLGKIFGFDCQHEAYLVERITAETCFFLMVGAKPEIRGIENLPPNDGSVPAPVYVANHASQIDLCAVYFLDRRFKWISKDSVRYLPGVGLIMSLSQHVFIKRTGKNKKSVANLYQQSQSAVQSGQPMFFFPQGELSVVKQIIRELYRDLTLIYLSKEREEWQSVSPSKMEPIRLRWKAKVN